VFVNEILSEIHSDTMVRKALLKNQELLNLKFIFQKMYHFQGIRCVSLASFFFLWTLRQELSELASKKNYKLQTCVRHLMLSALGKRALTKRTLGSFDEEPMNLNLGQPRPLLAVQRMTLLGKLYIFKEFLTN